MPPFRDLLLAGPTFARLLRSQHRDDAERDRRRGARLEETLRAAAMLGPYRRAFGGTPGAGDLTSLPPLPRRKIPDLHDAVHAGLPSGHAHARVRTSGSSGSPVWFFFDAAHQRGRFAARARYLWENGWRPHHRTAWMIGLLPGNPDGDLVRRRRLGGARFLSHVEDFEHQADWLLALDPRHLYTMPSNLDAVTRILEQRGQRLPALRTIFTSGEVLEESVRSRVRSALGVEIADAYGTTETFPAWQCPAGSYHVNDEHVVVEIVDDSGAPASPGEVGRVLLTTLENRVMPLVRYDIDDYAEAVEGPCRCGRTLPRIGPVHGRGMNLFRTASGGLLSPWKLVEPVRALPTVRKSQVIQHDVHRFTVRYVSTEAPSDEARGEIRRELEELAGPGADFRFERVDDIPRTGRGKYMSALCEIP